MDTRKLGSSTSGPFQPPSPRQTGDLTRRTDATSVSMTARPTARSLSGTPRGSLLSSESKDGASSVDDVLPVAATTRSVSLRSFSSRDDGDGDSSDESSRASSRLGSPRLDDASSPLSLISSRGLHTLPVPPLPIDAPLPHSPTLSPSTTPVSALVAPSTSVPPVDFAAMIRATEARIAKRANGSGGHQKGSLETWNRLKARVTELQALKALASGSHPLQIVAVEGWDRSNAICTNRDGQHSQFDTFIIRKDDGTFEACELTSSIKHFGKPRSSSAVVAGSSTAPSYDACFSAKRTLNALESNSNVVTTSSSMTSLQTAARPAQFSMTPVSDDSQESKADSHVLATRHSNVLPYETPPQKSARLMALSAEKHANTRGSLAPELTPLLVAVPRRRWPLFGSKKRTDTVLPRQGATKRPVVPGVKRSTPNPKETGANRGIFSLFGPPSQVAQPRSAVNPTQKATGSGAPSRPSVFRASPPPGHSHSPRMEIINDEEGTRDAAVVPTSASKKKRSLLSRVKGILSVNPKGVSSGSMTAI